MSEWLYRLIALVIGQVSPELRLGIVEWVKNLEERAKKTPNPWDDVFVGILKSVLSVKD